jgi:ribosome-associated protein
MVEKLLETIIEGIKDKKGKNIVSLDMRGMDGAICSYFVICDATSTTQVGAIEAGIEERVEKELGIRVWRVDGVANSLWIAMDYVDVVVHIFQTEIRNFYKLEDLWADAPTTRYEDLDE